MSDSSRKLIGGRWVRWNNARAEQARARGLWIRHTLADALREAARQTPDRVLLIDGSDRLNCQTLYTQSTTLAQSMLARASSGSVVSFMLPNWHEAAVIYMAATIAGMAMLLKSMELSTMARYRLLMAAALSINVAAAAHGTAVTSNDLIFSETPAAVMHQTNDPMFAGPEQTRLPVGASQITVTRTDLRQMQASLLDKLRRSKLADRDALIRSTQSAVAWIDPDNTARIGAWLLDTRGSQLVLVFRIRGGEQALDSYVAPVDKSKGRWTVGDIGIEHAVRHM